MGKRYKNTGQTMKNKPLVSILLPNLNKRPFLEERMDSILNQSYTNWELIIADSYSDDGSWEYLKAFANKDERITAYQLPKGLYQAWNSCIEKAQGEYIYIATSDDTMTLDCIGKMVNALEAHPECDICDSILKTIDVNGNEIRPEDKLGNHMLDSEFKKHFHIRYAPHDGFLYLYSDTIYTSLTQIMIRNQLFYKTGLFPTAFGARGDLGWGLKAGFIANVIFIPEKLASWRIYPEQASNYLTNLEVFPLVENDYLLLKDSLNYLRDNGWLKVVAKKPKQLIKYSAFRLFLLNLLKAKTVSEKLKYIIRFLRKYPEEILFYPYLFLCKRLKILNISDMHQYRLCRFVNKMLKKQKILILDKK